MAETRGLPLAEVLAVLAAIAVLGVLALHYHLATLRSREDARRIRCRSNLCQLGKGMATYLNEHGDGRWCPCPLGRGRDPSNYNGAEWLASLYWTDLVPDPSVFICPSAPDMNYDGEDLGTHHAVPGRFGSQTVSYAGLHYYSLTDKVGNPTAGAIREDFPPNEPMACDDTEGTINHGTPDNGGMSVLFFDSHVEFWFNTRIDLERGVGMKGGPLWRLRN